MTPDLAVITGTAAYRKPPVTYSNLWVLRLDSESCCREYIEWWMRHPSGKP